jgi:hypothetical protein
MKPMDDPMIDQTNTIIASSQGRATTWKNMNMESFWFGIARETINLQIHEDI